MEQQCHLSGLLHRVVGVCNAQLQRGVTFDESQPPSERNLDYRKLQEDLLILQVGGSICYVFPLLLHAMRLPCMLFKRRLLQ
jgi:hypothetical protein